MRCVRIIAFAQPELFVDILSAILRAAFGLAVILGVAVLVSEDRRKMPWRMVAWGLGIQIALAVLILKGTDMGAAWAPLGWPKALFAWISSLFVHVLGFTSAGAEFIFGDLARTPEEGMPPGTPLVTGRSWGSAFAFQVLPTIIFFGSLMAVLYHLGVMQRTVSVMARVVRRALGTSGAESLSAVANIFIGQTEAPLVIRPYLKEMTRSEIMAVMAGGMATIAGGVMAAYILFLGASYAASEGVAMNVAQLRFAEHLLGASLMAAPAALVIAKIMVPETGTPATSGKSATAASVQSKNVLDAAASGAGDGLKLALNIAAMLIAFLALIAMLDFILGWLSGLFGAELTLGHVLGWAFAPVAWCMGVPLADVTEFGSLVGISIVANEFVAYMQLAGEISLGTLHPKTVVMATFALCGFANFSSIAIMIGGIGPLAPSQKPLLASLGPRAVLAGTLANMMTATIAGVLIT